MQVVQVGEDIVVTVVLVLQLLVAVVLVQEVVVQDPEVRLVLQIQVAAVAGVPEILLRVDIMVAQV
jgi:hypothetical protein